MIDMIARRFLSGKIFILLLAQTLAVIHDCNHFHNGVYTIRFCAFSNITVSHDAEDIVFRSEYPRPYYFEFLDSRLTEIPRSMFTQFPEMQNLDVAHVQVENVNKYTFEHAKELRYLNMSGNRLTVLNNFVFKGCDKLVRLDVSNNRISEVKEKALVDAPKMDHLDLSNNLLHELDERLFASMPLLAYVSLANNRFQVLHDDLFVNCTMLAYLDLKGNEIEVLSDKFMKNLPFLRTLIVDNNKLKSLKIPAQLTKLFASFNRITSVYPEDSEKSQLYSLTLSNNNLNSIQNISNLEGLTILDVSFNAIGPLNLTIFLKMKKLTDLNLEATKLNSLEHGLFSQQTKLRRLDISYNFLRTLDITVLTSTPNLEKLFIDGNNLVEINYDHIPDLFPNLTYIGLFANVWNCSYLTTLVRFCNRNKIAVTSSKSYGEMSHLTNVQGIYCASSDKERIYFQPEAAVAHVNDHLSQERNEDRQLNLLVANMTSTEYEYKLTLELLDMIRQVNVTNRDRLDEVRKMALRSESSNNGCGDSGSHAAGFQVFIMLILTVILVINVGFMLYVQHNANARRAIDRMILFKRGEGASVQTQLEDI